MSKRAKTITWIMLGVLAVMIISGVLIFSLNRSKTEKKNVNFSEFHALVEDGTIATVHIDGYDLTGYEYNDEGKVIVKYYSVGPNLYDNPEIIETWIENGVVIKYETSDEKDR